MANEPDVRVRLTAEGVAEVVAALRHIQTEASAAGKKGAEGFLSMNRILEEAQGLLRGFAGAISVEKLGELVKAGVELATTERDIAIAGGTTIANVDALEVAAVRAGGSFEKAIPRLALFSQKIAELRAGVPEVVALFHALGLSSADFPTKDVIENLAVFGKRLSELAPSDEKAAAVAKLLSNRYAELSPIIEELGVRGMPALREEAVATGQSMAAVAPKAAELNASFQRLQRQALVFGATLGAELGPDLERTAALIGNAFSGETGEALGRLIALVLRLANILLGPVVSALDIVAFSFDGLFDGIITVSRIAAAIVTGHWHKAGEIASANMQKQLERADALQRRIADNARLGFGGTPPLAGSQLAPDTGGAGVDLQSVLQQALQARHKMVEAALAAELALFRAHAKARTDEDAREWQAGLLPIDEFFRRRASAIRAAAGEEISILERQRAAAIAAADNPVQAKIETTKISNDISLVRVKEQGDLDALAFDKKQEIIKLSEQRLSIEGEIQAAQGVTHLEAMAAIEKEARERRIQLVQAGATPKQADVTVGRLVDAKTARVNFEDIAKEASAAIAELQREERDIQTQVASGAKTSLQAEEAVLLVRKSSLPTLNDIAERLQRAAETTKDPALLAAAEAFRSKLKEVGAATDFAQTQMTRLKQGIETGGISALSGFLEKGVDDAHNFADAMRLLAVSVLDALRQITSQILATLAVKSIEHALGITSLAARDGGEVSNGKMLRLRDGGPVGGSPGTVSLRVESGRSPAQVARMAGFVSEARVLRLRDGGLVRSADGAPAPAITVRVDQRSVPGFREIVQAAGLTDRRSPWPTLRLAAGGPVSRPRGFRAGSTVPVPQAPELGRLADALAWLPLELASGGPVFGPGGPREDKVPAWLSNGEFVTNADSTGRPGVAPLLHAINRKDSWALELAKLIQGGVRRADPLPLTQMRFATGGLVGGGAGAGGGATSLSGTLGVELAPGLQSPGAFLETPEGERLLLRVIQKSPRAFGRAIGGR